MNELDNALIVLRKNINDPKGQSKYYDLFLNSTFFVPTLDEPVDGSSVASDLEEALPLVLESGGNDYLMLFDTKERLQAWAKPDVKWVEVPGHVLAATSMPPLHWALNVGTDYSKQFVPDEITWLKGVVEQCNAGNTEQSE